MKVKQTIRYARKKVPSISINDHGIIRFNSAAREAIGLDENQEIAFFQDSDHKTDWFIRKETGLRLQFNNTSKCVLCHNKQIAQSILKSLNIEFSTSMIMSVEPDDEGYYALITRSAR